MYGLKDYYSLQEISGKVNGIGTMPILNRGLIGFNPLIKYMIVPVGSF